MVATTTTACIEVGYAVAIVMPKDAAPLRVLIGQVEAIDDRGIRIAGMDWIVGKFVGPDYFVPWKSIESMVVSTPEHSLDQVIREMTTWQNTMEGQKPRTEIESNFVDDDYDDDDDDDDDDSIEDEDD